MNRSAPISFFGISEAKKVDSFSLNLRKAPLSSVEFVEEVKGIALILLLHLFTNRFLSVNNFLGPTVMSSEGERNGGENDWSFAIHAPFNNEICILYKVPLNGCFRNLSDGGAPLGV